MNFEEFETLEVEEKSALYKEMVDRLKTLEDVTAERDSFKNENEKLKNDNIEKTEELKKTKEMNFTLARKVNTETKRESAEDILHNMFK